ncbi:MAG: hypothetical protein JST43_10145 [Bacteroidetes bacterium]|nr:hypothetical protein [Bacteroidota bacterium]MBS1540450.1 hypothetical protein [Bacteroidota bacterium]
MRWTEILAACLSNPIRFPSGLFRVWLVEEKRQKRIGQILNEYDPREICLHGTNTFLQFIAAIGILLMLGMIIMTIIGIFRFGFTH